MQEGKGAWERTFREFDKILILLLELELSLQAPVPHDQVAVSFALLISSCRQESRESRLSS